MDNDGDLDCPYNFIDKTEYSSGVSSKKNSETGNSNSNRTEDRTGVPKEAIGGMIVLGMAGVFTGVAIYRSRIHHSQKRKK